MTRKSRLPPAQREIILECLNHNCQQCGQKMWCDYESERKLRTLEGIIKLRLYDELLAASLTDSERLKQVISKQEYVILAIDGMQPDVGHEVLWVIRDCISQEILLAKTI